jgi:hypothetical protein
VALHLRRVEQPTEAIHSNPLLTPRPFIWIPEPLKRKVEPLSTRVPPHWRKTSGTLPTVNGRIRKMRNNN